LDAENMWEQMEEILKRVAQSEDILSMTNLELVRYLCAMRNAEITEEGIWNPSEEELWFDVDGHIVTVGPRQYFQR